MIQLIEQPRVIPLHAEQPNRVERPATRNPMLLHCGGTVVDRDALFQIPTPRPTTTWFPLAHRYLVREVEDQLGASGFNILGETHAVSHDGARYFGVLELEPRDCAGNGHSWVVGLRNSHDKTFPAGLVAGTRVFVCDNLAFSGTIVIRRKHTRFATRDLRQLTARAVGRLGDRLAGMEQRITCYRGFGVGDAAAHDIVVRGVDCRAITVNQVPDVLQHWRHPGHEEFRPRTAWSLFNAFTEAFKSTNPHTAIARSEALNGLMDGFTGVRLS